LLLRKHNCQGISKRRCSLLSEFLQDNSLGSMDWFIGLVRIAERSKGIRADWSTIHGDVSPYGFRQG